MENGLAHEAAIVEIDRASQRLPDDHDGAGDLTQAFDHFGIKKLVLISPYVKRPTNTKCTI